MRTIVFTGIAILGWNALHSQPDVTPRQVVELETSQGGISLVDQAQITAANALWAHQYASRSDAAKPLKVKAKVAKPDPHLSPRASRNHARTRLALYGWSHKQFVCLDLLWTHESNWRSEALNKRPVNGKHAGGIPQILGLDPATPTTTQIRLGLDYIQHRYGSPCEAWSHWRSHTWY